MSEDFKLNVSKSTESAQDVEESLQEEQLTIWDVIKRRPSHKARTTKKVSRKLAEAEEWVDFLDKKRNKDAGDP